MKAVILAGGKGTRLQSVISEVPKPMAPVGGKPFLEYLVFQLKAWNISDIVLSVGYKKESILSYFSDGSRWGTNITYVTETAPLGTGGAIREALKVTGDEDIIVMNGDSFFDADINELIHYHRAKTAIATLSLRHVDDAGRYGRVVLDGHGAIISFEEKQGNQQGLINAGMYVLNRRLAPYFPSGAASFEREVLPKLVGEGLYGLTQGGFFIDIGIPDDYRSVASDPDKLFVRGSNA